MTAGPLSLQGKAALVTGGSGGIGAAIVESLSQAGARTANLDLREHGSSPASMFVECDVSSAESTARAVASVAGELGAVDLVVHCAGITRDGMLWKLDDDAWSSVIDVNLSSAFHLLKATTPHLRRSEAASVVLVSSINGERGKLGQANYAASKGGLIALGRTAARELGHFGIRVNCVCPGLIETEMTASLPQEVLQRAIDETVLGRAGRPADVANAVLFLCSPLSAHITGQVLRVDGGQLIG